MKPVIFLSSIIFLGSTLPQYSLAELNVDDLLNMSLEELMLVKIVSSTLTEESLKSVPSSITVYTRNTINRLGLKNLYQLANLVPGFQSSRCDDNALNYCISSRGRRLGTTGREILILIDGQRLNNDWAGGASQMDLLISLENVDRVEFIRGAGSAIYGSNAIMGVINIITRSENEINIALGNNEYQHSSGQLHAENTHGSMDVYLRYVRQEGEKLSLWSSENTHTDTRDPYRAKDVFLRGKLGDFSMALRSINRDLKRFYVLGTVDEINNNYATTSRYLRLGWKHTWSPAFNLDIKAYQSNKTLQVNTSLAPGVVINGNQNEEELGTQLVAQGEGIGGHWLLGWEWRNPTLTDSSIYINQTEIPPGSPEDSRYINGVFLQYQYVLTQDIRLTAGLRRDEYSDFGAHNSPRLALVQQFNNNNTFKLLYSEAFRAPSRVETSTLSPAFISNQNLKPETAKTIEAIWIYIHGKNNFSGTVFDTKIENAIQDSVTAGAERTLRTWVNGQEHVSGIELEWKKHWGDFFQSNIALTHIFNPIDDIHTESNNLLSGSFNYQYNNWNASILFNYQGEKVDPNEQNGDISTIEETEFNDRSIWDAHVSWQATPELKWFIHANNILDKQYNSPANRPDNNEGVPGPGRSLNIGITWYFD